MGRKKVQVSRGNRARRVALELEPRPVEVFRSERERIEARLARSPMPTARTSPQSSQNGSIKGAPAKLETFAGVWLTPIGASELRRDAKEKGMTEKQYVTWVVGQRANVLKARRRDY